MLRELLEEDYLVIQLFVSPGDLGQTGVSRRRTYIFCAHRERTRYLKDVHEVYARLCKVLRKSIQTQPGDYFVANEQQIQCDAARVAQTRNIPFQPVTWSVL